MGQTMRIGIIYYSYTGNTERVIQELSKKLRLNQHDLYEYKLEPASEFSLSQEYVPIKGIPDISGLDRLIMGTPVQGARMSGPMRAFFNEIDDFNRMQISFVLTHLFWKKWGAEQTIQSMKTLCEEKNGEYIGEIDVRWLSIFRNKRIDEAVEAGIELMNR